jgi:HAE1 family hydrophobic/amphiphilic exporter-1
MNWNISAWCIRNPISPIVLFLILTIAGVTAFYGLGIEDEPNIDVPYVSISVSQLGAAPIELETQVTRRVEDAVASIGNIKHIHSTVNTGRSNTSIEFELGTNSDRAMSDVREAVTRIRQQLPRGIDEPVIQREDFVGDSAIIYTIASPRRTSAELSYLVDNQVSRTLMATPGIGQVYRFGGVERQISVHMDPVRLEALGVTADQVNEQLRALNINLPGGRGEIGKTEQSIRTLGSAESVEKLRDTQIMLPGGRWTQLRALGTVTDGTSEPRHTAMLNGTPVVGIEIVRRRGCNIVDVERDSERVINDLQKKLPVDIKFTRVLSDAKYVRESCDATFESLVLGAVLAVLVIWLFLRNWIAALIAALAMPLSMIPTFAYMKSVNFTLNDMSLLGLALVIGILVDDAIVEIENIVRHMNMGKSPFRAAIDAADEIGLAVVATTMAAIVVFLPVAFMGGIPGQFFRQFGFTVAVAVFCSLLVARLITPVMAAYWMKHGEHKTDMGRLMPLYERILRHALKHRIATIVAAIVFFGASLILFNMMPTALVSRTDRAEANLRVELSPGSPLSDTQEALQRTVAIIRKRPEVLLVWATAGSGAGVNEGRIHVVLKPRNERALSEQQFEDAIRPSLSDVPGAKISFQGGWGSGNLQVLLTSYDPVALTKTISQLTDDLRAFPGVTDLQSSAAVLSPEIIVRPDFARAAEQGVSVESIARTASIATLGEIDSNTAKFDLDDRQVPIRVQLDPQYRHKLAILANLKVAGLDGRMVPLRSVATVQIDSGLFRIDRYDRSRKVSISAKLGSELSLGQAIKKIHELPSFQHKPASVKEFPAGDAEIQKDIFGGFGYAIATGVLLIYAVLVLLFRGFLQPLTIMMSLPLSLGGALVGLWMMGKSIDMYALIGIVMLMGLVTKNAILLVEYGLVAMERGATRTEAMLLAGHTRMRPIIMTTTAMIAGMIPIAMGIGAGAEARATMAIAVVGGLLTSTLLTLVVVPVVFSYMDDVQTWLLKRFGINSTDADRELSPMEKAPLREKETASR